MDPLDRVLPRSAKGLGDNGLEHFKLGEWNTSGLKFENFSLFILVTVYIYIYFFVNSITVCFFEGEFQEHPEKCMISWLVVFEPKYCILLLHGHKVRTFLVDSKGTTMATIPLNQAPPGVCYCFFLQMCVFGAQEDDKPTMLRHRHGRIVKPTCVTGRL